MAKYVKPLSMKPDAIRQRKYQERVRKELEELRELEARVKPPDGTGATEAGPVPSGKSAGGATSSSPGSYDAQSAPLHTTVKVTAGGPEQFAAPATRAPASDGAAPRPIVPQTPIPEAPPPPPKHQTTIEEAKLFAKAVVGYFKFGTGMLLAKSPEAMANLQQLAATDPEWGKALSPEGLAAFYAFVGGCAERTAIRYNLRIPYMDEGVTVAAIGIATFGMAYRPKNPGDVQRAKAAKDANVPKQAAKPATPTTPKNGKPDQPENPEEHPVTPIKTGVGEEEIDLS